MRKLYTLAFGLIFTCFLYGQKINRNLPTPTLKKRSDTKNIGAPSQVQNPVVFSSPTQISPTAVYSENFEGVTPPALPAGFTTGGAAGSDFFKTGTNVQANAGGYWPVPVHTKFAMSNDDVCNCDKSADWLELPQQDFTGKSGMTLAFSVFNDGKYATNDAASVEVNVNNGGWTLLYTIPVNLTAWQNLTVPFPANTDNQANVKVRFFWSDGGPTPGAPDDSWGTGLAIDDIAIDAPASINVEMTSELIYTDVWQSAYYAKIPRSQVGAMTFGGEVKNKGTSAAPNTKVNVNVTKGTSVFNTYTDTVTIPAGDSAFLVTALTYSPTDTGSYTVTYTASCDSTDSYPVDNIQSLPFNVTDTIFSRDDDNAIYQLTPSAFSGIAAVSGSYEFGNYYETVNPDTATSISFELGPTSDAGTTVQGIIYDSANNVIGQTDFYIILASDIGGFPAFKTVTLALQAPVVLGSLNYYIVTLADFSTTDSATALLSTNNPDSWTPGVMMIDGPTNTYGLSYYPFVRLNTKAASNPCAGIAASATATNVCTGNADGTASVNPTGGSGTYTFMWNNGQTGQQATGLAAGTYTVTVTDANSCTATASATVSATTINATVTPTNTTCGGNNGAAMVTATGGTSYTYLWSNGMTTATITGLASGAYDVTVTGNGICTKTATTSIASSTALVVTATSVDAGCGQNNGSASVTSPTGTGYTYSWTGGQTTAQATGLAAGSYTVAVTALAGGCMDTATVSVGNIGAPVVTAVETDIKCNGDSTGAINISISGGVTPYFFMWSNGSGTEDISGLAAGTYLVTVVGSDSCAAPFTYVVSEPAAIALTSVVSGGAVDLSVSGGTSPYTYLWSNSATTEDVSGLATAMYMVTVTDSVNCMAVDSFSVWGVGIAEKRGNAGFSLFPNPNKGTFNVQLSNSNGQYMLTMRNVLGQIVYTETVTVSGINTKHISLSNLGQGIYFLNVSGSDMNKTVKVTIK